jgi:hypothetical protein
VETRGCGCDGGEEGGGEDGELHFGLGGEETLAEVVEGWTRVDDDETRGE